MTDRKAIACVGNLTHDRLLMVDNIPALDDVAYVNADFESMGGRGAIVALTLGRLGAAGDNPRLNTLETARKAGNNFKIQYIISAIKNDIPDLSLLKDGEIVRTLSESDTLFGIDF